LLETTRCGEVKKLQELLEIGADIEASDGLGRTLPILEVVELLVAHGAYQANPADIDGAPADAAKG